MVEQNTFNYDRVLIYGFGKTGQSIYHYITHRYNNRSIVIIDDNAANLAQYTSNDSQNNNTVQIITPPHALSILQNDIQKNSQIKQIAFISPGISPKSKEYHDIITSMDKMSVNITNDIDFFYKLHPHCTYIAVTGTNGKSTTTSLIAHMLNQYYYQSKTHNVILAGNIGKAVMSLDHNIINDKSIIILELSSFQLELIKETKFDIAACLNIYTAHSERYASITEYTAAKKKIFAHTKTQSTCIISQDYSRTAEILTELRTNQQQQHHHSSQRSIIPISIKHRLNNGISIVNNNLYADGVLTIADVNQHTLLYGDHNNENIATAYATLVTLSRQQQQYNIGTFTTHLSSFQPLRHRMQIVGSIANITFINNSKATDITSCKYSVMSMQNLHLIIGGMIKDDQIEMLSPYSNNITCAYLVGESTEKFAAFFAKHNIKYIKCYYLTNAVNYILNAIQNRDIKLGNVMLSPGCASFDQWKNFEERGDSFVQLVQNYIDHHEIT